MNEEEQQQQRPISVGDGGDGDDISNASHCSFHYNIPTSSNRIGTEQPCTPIRVRDMIKFYNSAVENNAKPQTPRSVPPSPRVVRHNSRTTFVNQMNMAEGHQLCNDSNHQCCNDSSHSCDPSFYMQFFESVDSDNISVAASERSHATSRRTSPDCRCSRNRDPTELLSTSSIVLNNNANTPSPSNTNFAQLPIESSYQSKTTIARTNSGVRIIIEIFFDPNQPADDVVGSRVETDIPESRILTEFQEQAAKRAAERNNKK